MTKEVIFEPQERLLAGAAKLERAVASTLGPKGNTVIIESSVAGYPVIVTKDGVTVAKHIELSDPVENLGALIVKQAAEKTASMAGDGTTTSTIIANTIANEAYKMIKEEKISPIDIKRELDREVKRLITELESKSSEVTLDDILPIATISSNNDTEIGSLIHQAYEQVSLKGMIALEDSKTGKTHITVNEGYTFDRGWASPLFITDARKREAVLENPLVLVTDGKIQSVPEIATALELAMQKQRPLLVVADEIELQALHMMAYNAARGVVKVCAVRAPSFGENRSEMLRDIAALTSATFISKDGEVTLDRINESYFGTARRIVVSDNSTVIIDGKASPAVEDRIAIIEDRLKDASLDEFFVNQFASRLAGLNAKVAVIHVGAATETELIEVKGRVDDALRATRSAAVKGYVLGAGRTLFDLANSTTCKPLKTALLAPLKKLAESIGHEYEKLSTWMEIHPTHGLNVKTEEVVDLVEAKIFDPTLVIEQAIINAASAASMLLLSSTVVHRADRAPLYSPGNLDDISA